MVAPGLPSAVKDEGLSPVSLALVKRGRGPLDRSRQAAPQIFETLRARILSLELAPNTLLSRATLQAEFGVSQTPLRDALMKLDEEGLIEVYPQHATVVARIDLTTARQAHFLRLSVELEALRRIVPTADSGALADTLASHLARQREAQDAGDRAAFEEADFDFHASFYDAAAVPELWHLVRRHSGHIDRLRRLNLPIPGKIEAILADHEAILEAIRRRERRGGGRRAAPAPLRDAFDHRRHPSALSDLSRRMKWLVWGVDPGAPMSCERSDAIQEPLRVDSGLLR